MFTIYICRTNWPRIQDCLIQRWVCFQVDVDDVQARRVPECREQEQLITQAEIQEEQKKEQTKTRQRKNRTIKIIKTLVRPRQLKEIKATVVLKTAMSFEQYHLKQLQSNKNLNYSIFWGTNVRFSTCKQIHLKERKMCSSLCSFNCNRFIVLQHVPVPLKHKG